MSQTGRLDDFKLLFKAGMNHLPSEPAKGNDSDPASVDVRELFVTTDLRTIPAAESRAMLGSFGQWLSAMLRYKLLRSKSPPDYAIELRRMIHGKANHVPKRIIKHFDALKEQLEKLEFEPAFYANLPAIGPYSSALMAMSRQDGEVHFLATQVVTQIDKRIQDEGHLEFTTWLTDETSVVTVSKTNLPQPCEGVNRMIVQSEDPAVLLKKHGERLRRLKILPIPPSDLFQKVESEKRRQTDDLMRRGVIRPATHGEATRIRNDMRV